MKLFFQMLKRKMRFLKLFLPVFLISSQFLLPPVFAQPSKTIHILVTADLHGWLTSSLLFPTRKQTGLLHLQDHIEQLKQADPDLILLDAGDLLQGSPLTFYFHNIFQGDTAEDYFFKRFNAMGFDGVVVGNHDLAINPKFERNYVPKSKFSWLSANIYRQDHPVFLPYLIRNQKGLKIAIVGFTTPGVLMWLDPSQLDGMFIEPLQKSVQKWTRIIREKEKPDLMIGVFHVGLNPFHDDENSKLNQIPPANDLKTILSRQPDFDLVITGHDHRLQPYRSGQQVEYVGKIPVISGGCLGEALLLVKGNLVNVGSQWRINTVDVTVYRAKQLGAGSLDFEAYSDAGFRAYINEQVPWVMSTVLKSTAADCFNLLTSMAIDEPFLDGTLLPKVNMVNMRLNRGRKIERLDLFRWIKYDNKTVTVSLSERELYLLTHPIPQFGHKRIAYNRFLLPRTKVEIGDGNPKGLWLDKNSHTRQYLFKLSDYHYWGGGGVLPRHIFKPMRPAIVSEQFIREDLFHYLKETKQMPAACGFLRYAP